MHDQRVFDAMNNSQDGRPLGRRLGGHRAGRDAWDDALSDMMIDAYEQASDAGELLSHLRYCVRELKAAVDAVEGCHA